MDSIEQSEEKPPPGSPAPAASPKVVGEVSLEKRPNDMWIFVLELANMNVTDNEGRLDDQMLLIDSGCFGHVCPPTFLPEFSIERAEPLQAVAANKSKIEHFGQKTVYGAVRDHAGRGHSIKIVFQVMNVKRPMLSARTP